MCAGSVAAGVNTQALAGDALVVKDFDRHDRKHRLFAPKKDTSCPVCISFGSTVLFRNLSPAIQRNVNVGAEAKAQLVSPDVDFHHPRDDVFVFENKASIKLSELPEGTELDVILAIIEAPADMPEAVANVRN